MLIVVGEGRFERLEMEICAGEIVAETEIGRVAAGRPTKPEGAQRLLGVHVLVLAPIYGLLAWKRERYQTFLWIPYVVQSAVVTVTVLNMVTGDIDFVDGLLPLTVAATFLTLLIFVWRAGRLDIVPESELLSRFTSDDAAEEPVVEVEASVEAEEPANEDDSTPTPV